METQDLPASPAKRQTRNTRGTPKPKAPQDKGPVRQDQVQQTPKRNPTENQKIKPTQTDLNTTKKKPIQTHIKPKPAAKGISKVKTKAQPPKGQASIMKFLKPMTDKPTHKERGTDSSSSFSKFIYCSKTYDERENREGGGGGGQNKSQ